LPSHRLLQAQKTRVVIWGGSASEHARS
jgi:hypothetical protein